MNILFCAVFLVNRVTSDKAFEPYVQERLQQCICVGTTLAYKEYSNARLQLNVSAFLESKIEVIVFTIAKFES